MACLIRLSGKGGLGRSLPTKLSGRSFNTATLCSSTWLPFFSMTKINLWNRGAALCYYKSDRDDLSHPKGTIQLDHCQVLQLSVPDAQEKTNSNYAFELRQFSNNRVYTFVAQDAQDLKVIYEQSEKYINISG